MILSELMLKIFGRKIRKESVRLSLIVVFLLLLLPLTLFIALSNTETRKKASSIGGSYFTFQMAPPVGSNIYFDPYDLVLQSDTTIKIVANMPSIQVVFARIVFSFDTSKIQLSSDITPTSSLSTVVEKTAMSSVNSTGRAVVVIAASPADTPPNGFFELAAFRIIPVSTQLFDPTEIRFEITDMQIVDSTGQAVNVTATNASVRFVADIPTSPVLPTLTESPSPTDTVYPTATSVPTATTVPSATSFPTATIVPIEPSPTYVEVSPHPSITREPHETEKPEPSEAPEGTGKPEPSEVPPAGANQGRPDWAGKPEVNPCRRIKSLGCFNEMKNEYFRRSKARYADLNHDGKVNIKDIIIWIFTFRQR